VPVCRRFVYRGTRVPHRTARGARLAAAALTVVSLVGLLGAAPSEAADPPVRGARAGLAVRLVRDDGGRVRLLAATGTRSGAAVATSAATAARAHLDRVGRVFGVAARDLRTAGVSRVAGRDVVRFQQTRDGLPVLGGQLVMVLDGRGGLLSVSGETAGPATSTTYAVAASTAARTARRVAAARHRVARGTLTADRPTRWLLDRSLLDPRATPGLRPVWRVPVRSAQRADLRDLVLVDARTGRVALRLTEAAGLDRVVCDDVRTRSYRCRTGYDRVEGGPVTGIADVDRAYDLMGATAAWFEGTLGVDLTALIGNDLGDGRKLRSTTNFCPPGECPLDNAFWSGDQLVFGGGYTSADDVVAHELGHGVIQHTAGLVYWYQSGAINESMADVVGELVDLADGYGSDGPELRWQLGEDLPGGAGGVTRDMADPPRFGQPDTTRSRLYDYALDYDDNGAVHTNSGVPNKTAYLIADGTATEPGGTFAGRSFAGIGTARAATLYWATLQMLTPGSDFVDLAVALQQACVNLAFSAAECASVAAAVESTELARWAGPSVPRQVTATGGPGQVALTWSPPTSNGSAAVGSYVVAVTPDVDGEQFFSLAPSATSWVLEGLAPGVDYTVRLVAVSPAGTSPPVTRVLSGSAFSMTATSSTRWGTRIHVGGTLRNASGAGLPGRRVRLVRRDAGSSAYRLAASTRTGAGGTFGFAWDARRSARWYVVYGGAPGEVGVRGRPGRTVVHQRVTLAEPDRSVRPGQTVDLHGTVRPARDGRVVLQRRGTDGGWVPVARSGLDDGAWALAYRVPSARSTDLRVRVAGRPAAGLASGTSRVVTLRGSR
jgi:Zn-dependent metalloprotease